MFGHSPQRMCDGMKLSLQNIAKNTIKAEKSCKSMLVCVWVPEKVVKNSARAAQ